MTEAAALGASRHNVLHYLRRFDGDRYELTDFVVMPNHVHVLVAFRDEEAMLKQCAGWKRYTARQINETIGASGEFWQEDAFDHLVRGPEQFRYYRRYIAENGRRAYLSETDYLCKRVSRRPDLLRRPIRNRTVAGGNGQPRFGFRRNPAPLLLYRRRNLAKGCMPQHRLLIALDSVGIDPLGHDRPESVYGDSRFLFPRGCAGAPLPVRDSPVAGVLVETDVTSDHGHLEQLGSSRGHPKSKVPTWYFGPDAERHASRLTRPEGIFEVLTAV
jgi:REP element-mobilizing transposase RayT